MNINYKNENIKDIFIYEIKNKNDDINENIKKLASLVLNIEEKKEAIDLILYLIVIAINNKKYKKLKFLYGLLNKFEIEFFVEFIDDLKNIFKSIFDKRLYSEIFLKVLSKYSPLWLYNFLQQRKGLCDNLCLSYLEYLENEIKNFESTKKELDEIIYSNIKKINLNYIDYDYFSFI
ncbi:MAG: hypothetical protein N3A58_02600 [Spirochaetes bacterium]|nr:hypothetical protein [Spirochaetota bacterium]